MKEASFYDKKTNGEVVCRLCGHNCRINPGQTGICGVRLNENGVLRAISYGFLTSQNIDPIEKKPLFHFYPGSLAYSIGSLGCNFRCDNCQNYSISQPDNPKNILAQLDYITPERIIEEAIGNDCQSIAYTYNEPTLNLEYYLEIMRLAQINNLKNIWVTNGYMGKESISALIPYLDAVNVDLKSFEPRFYKNICSAKIQPVLDNLKFLKQEQVHLEITTLIIPTFSDDIEMLAQIAEFIVDELDRDTPWHLSKFSPQISWKMKQLSMTGEDVIYEAYEIGKEAGLKYIYVGNIPGDQKENTYCPKCRELAISRIGYHIERYDQNGRCKECDRSLDIVE